MLVDAGSKGPCDYSDSIEARCAAPADATVSLLQRTRPVVGAHAALPGVAPNDARDTSYHLLHYIQAPLTGLTSIGTKICVPTRSTLMSPSRMYLQIVLGLRLVASAAFTIEYVILFIFYKPFTFNNYQQNSDIESHRSSSSCMLRDHPTRSVRVSTVNL